MRWIGEDRVLGCFLPLVERKKCMLGHVDFAAHFADIRHIAALEFLRHILKRADIGGDVLALRAVTTGCSRNKLAALVTQRHREAVDLWFGAESEIFIIAQFQKPADAGYEVDDVLLGEGIVE